jgi:choline dehydrogenase-like flavoprotein
VGAGPSAMGLLYGLLEPYNKQEELPPFTIAVVERGTGPPHDAATESPSNWYDAAHTPSSTSASHVSTEITGRTMDLPIGQGLGGTSNINACLCTPPLPQDLESWPEPWRTTLPTSVKSIQTVLEENKAIHYGIGNLQDVASPFLEKASIDMSNRVPTMVTRDSQGRFVRSNYYDALLAPLLKSCPNLKKNLFWFQGTEVQRLLLEGHRIIGVDCISNHVQLQAHATREVILCAGAIETPVLLLTSGIGLDEPLRGVGRHLKDQVLLSRTYLTKWTRNAQLSTNGIAALGHLNLMGRDGMFQVAIADANSHVSILPSALAMAFRRHWKTDFGNRIMEVVFVILKAILKYGIQYTPLGYVLRHFTATTLLFLMHPKSEGSISIKRKTNCPRDEPMMRRHVVVDVDVGYLKDIRDLDALRRGWKACGRMGRCLEVFPGWMFRPLTLLGIDWFQCYCYCFALPYFHFCGTCIMQTERKTDWVVDAGLRLREHTGLYICDSSVFPAMVSSPPALTCTALGHAFSQILISKSSIPTPN